MCLFKKLLDHCISLIIETGGLEIKLPSEYSTKVVGGNRSEIILSAAFYNFLNKGEFRLVNISSKNLDIINIFFFPNADWNIPIFAMEFVVFGAKPIVAVIDIKPILVSPIVAATAKEILIKYKTKYSAISYSDKMPDWYLECRSGNDLFIRPENLNEIFILNEFLPDLLHDYINILSSASPLNISSIKENFNSINNYKKHHKINSPGLPLLYKKFGNKWANTFLSKYLFT